MRVSLRLIASGLSAISAFTFTPMMGCTNESNPSPLAPSDPQPVVHVDSQPVVHIDSLPASHFRLGPFYGFDSLRHYEYSNTSSSIFPTEPIPDTGRVTTVGYLVDVQAPALDTIRLRIGTRRLRERYVSGERDSAYNTLYASYTYLRKGTGFVIFGTTEPPFPFLDRAYVAESDTSHPELSQSSLTIDNLSAALRGEQAQYTHVFSSGYAGGGSSYSVAATYRQGIGMARYYNGSAYASTSVLLVSANP